MAVIINGIKNGYKYIAVFLASVVALTGMLVLIAKIPQSSIKGKVQESAEYLCDGELFGFVIDGVKGSEIDRYADSILLAIAYQYDDRSSLKSVMSSSYYYTNYQNENENLLEAVTEGYDANQQYLRYWHGSNVFVRPLLVFLNIRQIYVLNGIIIAVLVIILTAYLIREKAYAPAAGVIIGLIMTASWFVCLSLEYTWTYILMMLMSIIGLKLECSDKRKYLGVFFMVAGILTNYVDFLTTETLTLLVPLLLILWVEMQDKNRQPDSLFKNTIKWIVAWGFGYVGMWIMKWVLASFVLKVNALPYVTGHIEERIGGDIGVNLWQCIIGAVLRNFICLFPFGYGGEGMLAGAVMVFALIYAGYVHHKKRIRKDTIIIFALLGLIPYIRYMVLHNHSYLHCFFTYRAQLATILAIVLIMDELTEWRWPHADNRKRKS